MEREKTTTTTEKSQDFGIKKKKKNPLQGHMTQIAHSLML